MKNSGTAASILAVISQFWDAAGSYRLLRSGRNAGIAMISAVLLIAMAGYVPALFIDWNEVQQDWRAERMPRLTEEGYSHARADSLVSSELQEMRQMTSNLPMARLVERGVIALIAALAAFGIVYAVEGRKVGTMLDYFTSSVMCQGAYMLTGVILIALVTLLNIPPSMRLNLSFFVPADVAAPSRIHVFIYRFTESIDIPSLVSLFLWGSGIAAMVGRQRSWGLRLSFSVYILGILLISLPVMFAPAA